MLQVLHTYCGSVHHILRLNKPNKNQGTKPSADKEHDPTLPPKQYGKEGMTKQSPIIRKENHCN